MTVIKNDGTPINNVTAIRLLPVPVKKAETETTFRVDSEEGSVLLTPTLPVHFSGACSILRSFEQADGYFVFPECTEAVPEAS